MRISHQIEVEECDDPDDNDSDDELLSISSSNFCIRARKSRSSFVSLVAQKNVGESRRFTESGLQSRLPWTPSRRICCSVVNTMPAWKSSLLFLDWPIASRSYHSKLWSGSYADFRRVLRMQLLWYWSSLMFREIDDVTLVGQDPLRLPCSVIEPSFVSVVASCCCSRGCCLHMLSVFKSLFQFFVEIMRTITTLFVLQGATFAWNVSLSQFTSIQSRADPNN